MRLRKVHNWTVAADVSRLKWGWMGVGLWLAAIHLMAADPPPFQARTTVSLVDHRWHLNGKATYPGTRAEGLLMNVRMVNCTFEDRNRKDFDAERNTDAFIARIPDYAAHGVRAFTLCLQGGMPGYEGALNSAFNPDGSLREAYLRRVARAIEACDQQGMAVILGCYYQRQSKILRNDAAIRAGVVNVVRWLKASGYRNVLLEVANEYPHQGFAHELLRKPEGEAELMRLAKTTWPDLLASTSGLGDGKLHEPVARAGDFLLIHLNGIPARDIPERIRALRKYNRPIVCNEDDKTRQSAIEAAEACLTNGASYGLMLSKINQYQPFTFKGAQDDSRFYGWLKAVTTKSATKL